VRLLSDLGASPLFAAGERHCTIGFGNFAKGDFGFFSNYPREFQETYHKRGWVKLDPVVRACAPRAVTFDWDNCTGGNNPVMTTAREFGMEHGFSASSHIAGSGMIVSYAGVHRLSDVARAHAAQLVHKSHVERLGANACLLNAQQRELVALFAHGMRASMVAQYFEVTEDAIKLRKRRIESIIGVNNFLAVVHICAVAGVTTSL